MKSKACPILFTFQPVWITALAQLIAVRTLVPLRGLLFAPSAECAWTVVEVSPGQNFGFEFTFVLFST